MTKCNQCDPTNGVPLGPEAEECFLSPELDLGRTEQSLHIRIAELKTSEEALRERFRMALNREKDAWRVMFNVIQAKDAHHAALRSAASTLLDALDDPSKGRDEIDRLAALDFRPLTQAICDLNEPDEVMPASPREELEEVHNP